MSDAGSLEDVVFDLGGVLVDWNPRHLFVNRMGLDADEVEHFLATVCTTQWHLQLDAGLAFHVALTEVLEAHPNFGPWIEAYGADWPGMFAGAHSETVEQLHKLAEQGFRLHALTNYPAEQIRFLYESYDFMASFDSVIVSGLHRLVKPEPEIYRRLLDTIGARTCLFIDDREENVRAAEAQGIQTIHFTPEQGLNRLKEFVAGNEVAG